MVQRRLKIPGGSNCPPTFRAYSAVTIITTVRTCVLKTWLKNQPRVFQIFLILI